MLMDIIQFFLDIIQSQNRFIAFLISLLNRHLPLRDLFPDDSKSPKYQKFKTDELPVIRTHASQDWDYKDLIPYYQVRYGKKIRPVSRRAGSVNVPEDCSCPTCKAPAQYLYRNNGSRGQLMCKICQGLFSPGVNLSDKVRSLLCPHCGHVLVAKKDRKSFRIHKCVNPKCPYYISNLKKVDKSDLEEDYGKNKYKLHYIYREFTLDFFRMDLDHLPKNASSLRFSKFDAHVMSLCLTLHINLSLSLRKTAWALQDLYGISISHQQVANYCRTAALCVKPFVDHFDYRKSDTFVADETYIKVRGVKGYVWFIMDAVSRSIIGYRVSDTRAVGPCILAMRMAFRGLEKLPEKFRFIADGYSAYLLAAQQFALKFGKPFTFVITQVIGLTNDDAVSKEFRPFKQMIERLNRTFKASYRDSCGYHNFEGANYSVSLWVAYYNFLRRHKSFGYDVLNHVDLLDNAPNMPARWQLMIYLGQRTILSLQQQPSA